MKRYVIALISIASLLLASCRIEKPFEEPAGPGGAIAARALLPSYSKISYEETPSGGLKGSWEAGDVIFGFTADGTPVEFKVLWSSDPAASEDYTSPFTETSEACQKPLDGYICGYEYTVAKGTSSTVVTTLKKL